MILQRMVLPESPEMEKDLYYKNGDAKVFLDQGIFTMGENGVLDLMSYFNSFSAGKWRKYTQVKQVDFTLDFCGHVSVAVYHKK